ncbi:MAG: hypothetical protein RR500_04000 [Bacilli bacterium]
MRTVGMVKKNKTKNLKDAEVATLKKEKHELEEKVTNLEIEISAFKADNTVLKEQLSEKADKK